jgi:tRNA-modifying protein YgfZ
LKQDISGYAALRRSAGAAIRRDVGHILLTGADTKSYLQGLLTNDIAALTPGSGCYSAMLTAQGRMLTDMRVFDLGDAVLLSLPRSVAAAIAEHLDRFVFSEDVQVADVTQAREEVALYGPHSAAVLVCAGVQLNVDPPLYSVAAGRIAEKDVIVARSDSYGIAGYDLIVAAGAANDVFRSLMACGASPVTERDLDVVRVESGYPLFGIDMTTDTIPLEAGLDARAISRTKGCYVGQEVIVRVLDRGHGRVARHFVGLVAEEGAVVPSRDAQILAAGKVIGRVTSAAESPSVNRAIALGYVQRDFVAPGTEVEVEGAGRAQVSSLPLVPSAA